MVEGTRPGLTRPAATQAGDRCNKAAGVLNRMLELGRPEHVGIA